MAHLGKCHLGNCHLGSSHWENAFRKTSNTVWKLGKSWKLKSKVVFIVLLYTMTTVCDLSKVSISFTAFVDCTLAELNLKREHCTWRCLLICRRCKIVWFGTGENLGRRRLCSEVISFVLVNNTAWHSGAFRSSAFKQGYPQKMRPQRR